MNVVRTLTPDVQALKIYQDHHEQLWYTVGDTQACKFSGTIEEFIGSKEVRTCICARVLGIPRHADLLVRLHTAGIPVQVASPGLVALDAYQHGGVAVLLAMRGLNIGYPASLGGWHALRTIEFLPYKIRLQMSQLDPAAAVESLQRLPMWPVWEFFHGLDLVAMAGVVADILDPRWFVATTRPESDGRLRCYLGLTPRMARWLVSDRLATPPALSVVRAERYGTLRQALFGQASDSFTAGPHTALLEQYRELRARGCEEWLAELRTLQRFLTFLRFTWLEELYRAQHKQHEPLFVPQYFFNNVEYADAFTAHYSRCKCAK